MAEKSFEELQQRALALRDALTTTRPELHDVEIVKELQRTYFDGYNDAIESIQKNVFGREKH